MSHIPYTDFKILQTAFRTKQYRFFPQNIDEEMTELHWRDNDPFVAQSCFLFYWYVE